jgi:hypothetical protein
VTGFARSLLGYWPAFVLAGIAAALIVAGYPLASLPFDAASLTYSVIRYRRAVAQRQMERTSTPARVVMHGRRTFEPYTLCPSCEVATYHVFGAPRERTEEAVPVSVWNSERTYRFCTDAGEPEARTVVDRECLSCGHEWTEDV